MKNFWSFEKNIVSVVSYYFFKITDNQDSADVDPQEHSFTRTIDEEAEMEELAERDREDGHPEPEDEEEEREHEVMTAGSKYILLHWDVRILTFCRKTEKEHLCHASKMHLTLYQGFKFALANITGDFWTQCSVTLMPLHCMFWFEKPLEHVSFQSGWRPLCGERTPYYAI